MRIVKNKISSFHSHEIFCSIIETLKNIASTLYTSQEQVYLTTKIDNRFNNPLVTVGQEKD